MSIRSPRTLGTTFLALLVISLGTALTRPVVAQNPDIQAKIAEVKQAAAANKQALAQYTYVETTTVSLKGEEKKAMHNQVRTGPDGKPQKTSLDPPEEAAAPSGGRVKQKVVAKKKEEYKEYAESMKQLAAQYVPPDKDLLQQAAAQGNIAVSPAAGNPNGMQLVIKNYVKPGDSMTLVFDKTQKAILSLQIASYMTDPKDAMNLTVQFAGIPGGPNHPDTITIDGVSKQMKVVVQNSNYQHL